MSELLSAVIAVVFPLPQRQAVALHSSIQREAAAVAAGSTVVRSLPGLGSVYLLMMTSICHMSSSVVDVCVNICKVFNWMSEYLICSCLFTLSLSCWNVV